MASSALERSSGGMARRSARISRRRARLRSRTENVPGDAIEGVPAAFSTGPAVCLSFMNTTFLRSRENVRDPPGKKRETGRKRNPDAEKTDARYQTRKQRQRSARGALQKTAVLDLSKLQAILPNQSAERKSFAGRAVFRRLSLVFTANSKSDM